MGKNLVFMVWKFVSDTKVGTQAAGTLKQGPGQNTSTFIKDVRGDEKITQQEV